MDNRFYFIAYRVRFKNSDITHIFNAITGIDPVLWLSKYRKKFEAEKLIIIFYSEISEESYDEASPFIEVLN